MARVPFFIVHDVARLAKDWENLNPWPVGGNGSGPRERRRCGFPLSGGYKGDKAV
jgi:hypothetical protein